MAKSAVEDAATVRVTLVILAGQNVVLPILDRFGAEDMVKVVTSWILINPFTDRVKHIPLNFDSLVTEGWVVESTKNIVNDFFDRNSRVFPSIENSAIKEVSK